MEYSLQDIVIVETKCEKCGLDGEAPTFKQILDDRESILAKMILDKGYADILCMDCAAQAVDKLGPDNG